MMTEGLYFLEPYFQQLSLATLVIIAIMMIVVAVIAALVAWRLGRATALQQAQNKPGSELAKHYFQGVNFLLKEQPDQAIDVFIESVEVTPQTLETHLSLGNLMRQKGEVNRAIRVHQNLLSRPNLSPQQIRQAHLELAKDYLKAGLFDRAERLFLELVEDSLGDIREQSLRHLVQIYRSEQEWEKAIRATSMMEKKLFGRAKEALLIEQAHFCCELAEQAKEKGDYLDVRRHLKSALKFNKNSARANILWGDQEMLALNFHQALKRFRQVPQQQPGCLPEILDRVRRCYQELDDTDGLYKQLTQWLRDYPNSSVLKIIVDVISDDKGNEQGIEFLVKHLQSIPSLKGVNTLLHMELQRLEQSSAKESLVKEGSLKENLSLLQTILENLDSNQAGYRCTQCGFKGISLHWLCPQCQSWETVKPAKGLMTE